MRRTCNPPRSRARPTSRTTIAGLFSLLLAAPSFADDEDPRWNIAGWTPSIAASVGVHVTDMTGYINATDSADNPVRPPVDTQDFAIVPMIRVSLDLESPPIHERLGDVRAFFGVDYFATLPPGRNITAEGNPASFFIRDGILDPPEQAIEGQGSALAVRTNRLAYGATAGLAVPIEILGIRVFVKPGVSWMRQQWDLDGVVKRAFKVIRPPMVFSREFRGVELDANGKLYTHGVGPYLGVEIEPEPLGPVLVALFAEAAYFRTLGDQDVNISHSVFISDGEFPDETYTGRWGIEVEDDFWRAAVGLRFYLAAGRKGRR